MNDIAMTKRKYFWKAMNNCRTCRIKKDMLEISDIEQILKDKSISAGHISLNLSVSGGEKDRCSSEYGRSFFGRR